MSIKAKVQDDIKTAMRARNSTATATLRLLLDALKKYEIDQQTQISDETSLAIIQKLIKQRRESAEYYSKANRPEQANSELAEATLLETYLPPLMDLAAIQAAVKQAIEDSGAHDVRDTGKVMARLKTELANKADFAKVAQCVKEMLNSR